MSGAASRRKGHNWEREVARALTEVTGRTYKRVLTETREGNQGDVRSNEGSPAHYPVAAIHRTGRGGEKFAVIEWGDFLDMAADLENALGVGLVVQCKCGARPDIYGAIKQAQEAA